MTQNGSEKPSDKTASQASTSSRVSKANRFAKPGESSAPNAFNSTPPPAAILPIGGHEIAVVMTELTNARTRITDLESQLKASEQGRRDDMERLLRELMEAKVTIARLEAEREMKKGADGEPLKRE